MAKMPKKCPACNKELVVTKLTCPNCSTEVTGLYPQDLFSRLEPNDYDFIVLFIRTKGNIKEMERELGISYWTIRSKLNDLVTQLGLEDSQPVVTDIANRREQILEQLNSGLISVSEAAALLEKLRKLDS